MSEYVEFTPNGLVLHKWNGKQRKYVPKRPKKLTIITHLRSRCEIAEGTTLKHIFEAVDKYKFLKMVMSQYSWCRSLEEFHAQAREPMRSPKKDEYDAPLEYLEIYHHPEVHQFAEKKKHPGGTRERTVTVDFDTHTGFHGIGGPPVGHEDDPHYKTDSGKINYSVSCTPMYDLADLPVKLNKSFDVYEPFVPGTHKKGKMPEKLLTATREFSLLDVLDAIYDDISFYGGPGDNQEFIETIQARMDDITSGNVPGIPLDAIRGQLDMDAAEEPKEGEEPKFKIILHPDLARQLGVDPDSIPLDDKEIFRPDES